MIATLAALVACATAYSANASVTLAANATQSNNTAAPLPSMQIFAHPENVNVTNSTTVNSSTTTAQATSSVPATMPSTSVQSSTTTIQPAANESGQSQIQIMGDNPYLTSASWIMPGLLAVIEIQESNV